ncbi:MAG: hypothetical protein DRN15_05165 [Thermoprotei archaeon]|nr:MAG: hypothetical protein DRN15_05165 [Thermoprotei archaeon]
MTEAEEAPWIATYFKLREFLDTYDKQRRFRFAPDLEEKFRKLRERLREDFVRWEAGGDLKVAIEWVEVFKRDLSAVEKELGLRGALLSKEFKSFVEDPLAHLKKKIFIYLHDLLRGKIRAEEFERTAGAAVRTSLRTNMRTVYQSWVFITLLRLLGEQGARIVYPEHKCLLLERSGRQKAGGIPPNCIIHLERGGSLSFFLEAPRPIGWEDTEDLKKAWSLYTAMRPDMLVYAGEVMDIVRLGEDPPILRPNIVIECKELSDWYLRAREIRGPFAKPLTAEEWRSKWLEGLWEGLADVLGVKRSEAIAKVEEKKAMRLKDLQIVALYRSLYKPDAMFLVSRDKVPREVKSYLENRGIEVVDGVGFNMQNLKPLAERLMEMARKVRTKEIIELRDEGLRLLDKVMRLVESQGIRASKEDVIINALRLALSQEHYYLELLKRNKA